MTTFQKKLYERPFEAIKKGSKKIEIRANKKETSENSVNLMQRGDEIIFTKSKSEEKISCIIERITLYNSTRELLEKEGTKYTLSSTDDLEEGIRSIESIGDYKELIAKNGVFAIELKDVKEA
ncbi:MAG: ASCH domain-containing protein [Candidatus Woesearchaeota archaeon]